MAQKSVHREARRRTSGKAPVRARNEVRIIGGRWRGRRVAFAPVEGLRPSPDRVRETLFNWLRNDVAGSRCLDLFAGSGVLGIEALSRGAARATFVERDARAAEALRSSLDRLEAAGADVRGEDALHYLLGVPSVYDIVFLDPPFAAGLLPEVCRLLAERGWLAPAALVYLEQPARLALGDLPAGWEVLKSKRAGEVGYHLARSSPCS